MSSARDAADEAIFEHGVAHRPMALRNAVLAALGIPADADSDDVRAAMVLRDALATIQKHRRSFTVEWDEGEPEVGLFPGFCAMADYATVGGDSMAAAVVALASRLIAQGDTDA